MKQAPGYAVVAVAALLAAGCATAAAAPPAPKLSAAVICQRWDAQTLYLTYVTNPSPSQAAQLDAEVAADANESASAPLAAALRAEHGIGEAIASGDEPAEAEHGVSAICANYP